MTRRKPGWKISRITHKNSDKRPTMRIILFIVSEILFFISFFWAFFHTRPSPTIELGSTWPPTGIQPFNSIQTPLLNTAILLASGVTVTWAHHGLLETNATQGTQGLFFTVLLGIYFTALQAYEYFDPPFTIADSAYGLTFFCGSRILLREKRANKSTQILKFLRFLNHALWHTYIVRTNKMHPFFINVFIQSYCLRHVCISLPEDEHLVVRNMSKTTDLNY
jgi:hypothetical protein